VVDASSTHAFKKSLRERRFDLVILDCLNPEIDPAECINALRDCALNKATAVLCFSNSSNVLQDTEIIKGSVKVVLTDNQVDSTQIERFINEISTIQRKVLQK
jgi:PleD family two-component response regulator